MTLTTHHKEIQMADKSPRSKTSKKSGKSIKEKRAEKHAKHTETPAIIVVPKRK